ncbi:hypothetical protein KUC_3222 [Vreelandella boliviensis LC1]|uniref:Uncharacterized protein n=1 Tax=Vreelandella boliviensis LC1 TaxID=1072583 RepID=A0A7U9BYQ0_9GAMM|nr:hypothetical protein KUC_3222 [Halomonas boliviensis LC1]
MSAFLMFGTLTNIELAYRPVVTHDPGPDFAALALFSGQASVSSGLH